MPVTYSQISFRQGTKEQFGKLTPDPNSVYFVTDTKQVYIGSDEYTTSALVIDHRPADGEQGSEGRFYVCTEDGSSFIYVNGTWMTVYDPTLPCVRHVYPGDTIDCNPNPITTDGTVSHGTPEGASELVPDTTPVDLKLGQTFVVHEVHTDKFGHVVGVADRNITMPTADELSTVFKFKGVLETQDNLPTEGNSVGDVYYVKQESSEFVYLETGWEKLGPVVDLSGLVPKVPNEAGKVAAFADDGSVCSAGYEPESGVAEGTYGSVTESEISVPELSVDKYGRVTLAENNKLKIVSSDLVADYVAWTLDKFLR